MNQFKYLIYAVDDLMQELGYHRDLEGEGAYVFSIRIGNNAVGDTNADIHVKDTLFDALVKELDLKTTGDNNAMPCRVVSAKLSDRVRISKVVFGL